LKSSLRSIIAIFAIAISCSTTQAALIIDWGNGAGKYNVSGNNGVALTVANGGSNDDTSVGSTGADWVTYFDGGSPNGPNGISWTVGNGGLGFNPTTKGVLGTDTLAISIRINPTGAGNYAGFAESVGLFEMRFLDSGFGNQIRYQFLVDFAQLSTANEPGGATSLVNRPFTTFQATTTMANPTSGTYNPTLNYANWRLVSLDNPSGTNGTPGGSYNLQFNDLTTITAVPEPTSIALGGAAIAVAALRNRLRRRRQSV
jgi:hypothetical protein